MPGAGLIGKALRLPKEEKPQRKEQSEQQGSGREHGDRSKEKCTLNRKVIYKAGEEPEDPPTPCTPPPAQGAIQAGNHPGPPSSLLIQPGASGN